MIKGVLNVIQNTGRHIKHLFQYSGAGLAVYFTAKRI